MKTKLILHSLNLFVPFVTNLNTVLNENKTMVFCASWGFFRKFSSLNKTWFEIPFLSVSSVKAFCIYAGSSSEDLKALAAIFCYQMMMTKLSPLLFSVRAEASGKKLRSTVQRSTETGLAVEMRNWMTRQASRESTDGSMNSYSSEGKWVTLAVPWSPCLAGDLLLYLTLCAFTKANSYAL